MYTDYWDLHERPFENCADQRFYYPSEGHQGALLKLRYAIENRRGGALLTGGAGTGKTLLVGALKRQLGPACMPFVHLVFPQMSSRELLAYLAVELGAAAGDRALAMDESVRALTQFLCENTARGQHAVVVIDEAQLLTEPGVLDTLRLLLNFEAATQPALALLLVGESMLLPAVSRLPMLEQRLSVKCLLRALTLDQTASYVNHRLVAAGASREIFLPDAIEALQQLTHGAPRQINRLCDLALLVGFAEELPAIGERQIEAVADELVTIGGG